MRSGEHTQSTLRSIFVGALLHREGAERRRYIQRACGENLQLRQRVERLLSVRHAQNDNPLDKIVDVLGLNASIEDELPAEDVRHNHDLTWGGTACPTIGPYKLREQIGDGGMGVVYVAEQTEPIRRQVALKIIKPGMDSQQVIARFEAERQTLAMMSHPHIARVLDGGTTDTGRPYFVMELVRGIPITQFCSEQKLTVRERLELFVLVCQAVQHAHLKGIIHRDLKPGNVLVELHDVTPVPKVIDFGVAKAINQQLTQQTIYTQFSQLVGTPLYMSPEQIQLSGVDVDTRSDVYSLGVLLYELLTGTTPFGKDALIAKGYDEMRRIIREDEPPRPSHMVSTLANEVGSTVADRRKPDSRRLSLAMRRELDWIVMKALEKDRTRRYESASAFAQDVQRYLRDEPVQAYPPSVGYRLRKHMRRHKAAIIATASIILTLIGGIVVSSHLAVRATHAEQVARQEQTNAERTAGEIRELLYASDIMLASQAWRHNDVRQVRERLSRHIPGDGEPDLRGFEWHYLWKQQEVDGTEIANVGSAVYDLAFSPDGRLFAATGADAMVRFFNMETGEPRGEFFTGQGETNGIAFSPNSKHLAAAGDDGTVRVWDVKTHQEVLSVAAHEGKAFQVRFSPDGKHLVTCGDSNIVHLWDAATGAPLGSRNEHEGSLEAITVLPDGAVVAGDRRGRVTIQRLDSKLPELRLDSRENEAVSSFAFSSSGDLAFGTISGLLTIVNVRSHAVTSRRRFADGIQSLGFSPSGHWLAVGDRSGNVRTVPIEDGVWDLETSRDWPAHAGRVYSVEVSPNGRQILSGGADGRIVAWVPLAGAPHQVARLQWPCVRIASLDDGRFVVSAPEHLTVCNRGGNVLRKIARAGEWGSHINVLSSSQMLYGAGTHQIAGWDIDTGNQTFHQRVQDEFSLFGLAISPDEGAICAFVQDADGDRELQILQPESGNIISRLSVRSANHRDISPDGRLLAFDSDHEIVLYDLTQHRILHRYQGHQGAIRDVHFTQDGQRLASISADRTLKTWSVSTGDLEYSVTAHRTDTVRLAMTPDGRRIATAGYDRMLRLWDGQNPHPVWEYPLLAGQILDLCFSDDGERLYCLCNEHEVVILDGSPDEEN